MIIYSTKVDWFAGDQEFHGMTGKSCTITFHYEKC